MYRKKNNKRITFYDGNGYIINDYDKQFNIVNYIYSKIDPFRYHYRLLKSEEDVELLKNKPHYVVPNFKGLNYFLIFISIMECDYCVCIDGRALKKHMNDINFNDIKIISTKIRINKNAYNGTIFNGKIIRRGNKSIFLIMDCYYLNGEDLRDMDIFDKLETINNYINDNIYLDNNMNPFDIKINKYHTYDDLKMLAEEKIKNGKSSIPINGLIFSPQKSGISIVWLNKEYVNVNSSDTPEKKQKEQEIAKNNKNKSMVAYFMMKKTDMPDVYHLFVTKDNQLKKYGIALVRSKELSFMCRELFNKSGEESMKMKCVYNKSFKKWMPVDKTNEDVSLYEDIVLMTR